MNSVRLSRDDGTEFGWQCQCGNAWGNGAFGGADGAAKQAADECCDRHCARCGVSVRVGYTACDACRRTLARDREAALFRKARRVPLDEYDGEYVCFGYDRYVPTDCAEGEDGDCVDGVIFAWGCEEIVGPRLDAGGILVDALEDHYEGAIEAVDATALQSALDEWCGANRVVSYLRDDSVVVVLPASEGADR